MQFNAVLFMMQREMQVCSTATKDLGTVMGVQECAELCHADRTCWARGGWFQHDRTTGSCKTRPDGGSACSFSTNNDKDYYKIMSSKRPDYVLEKYRVECNNNDKEVNLGSATSVEDCASKCKSDDGANRRRSHPKCGEKGTFIFGTGTKGGNCWTEGYTTSECSTWDLGDAYDFYTLTETAD